MSKDNERFHKGFVVEPHPAEINASDEHPPIEPTLFLGCPCGVRGFDSEILRPVRFAGASLVEGAGRCFPGGGLH